MPELPDVEIYRRYLNATSLHQEITKVEIRTEKILEGISSAKLKRGLRGRAMKATRRWGKYLFAELDSGSYVMMHFGMTGNLSYQKNLEDEPPHGRLLIGFSNGYYLIYISQRLLGKVSLITDVEKFVKDKGLGPDVLDIDYETFGDVLRKGRGSLKTTLMNQKLFAGIGNVYSDEILFRSRLHPKTEVGNLDESDIKKLFRKTKEVMETAIESGVDPGKFPRSYLLPHRNEGEKCPYCKDHVTRMKISGRSAYYCPACQSKAE
jgi:formamidopyrimidine-DNA glycosylase